jgi:hypothetical protein
MFSPNFYVDRFVLQILQIFLVGGVAANYFDEIIGRPWHTEMPERYLWFIGTLTLIASNVIGIYLSLTVSSGYMIFSLIWSFFAVAYDLELFNGMFHNTISLAFCWGSVCLGGYYLQSLKITSQIMCISIISGLIAGKGRILYETSKAFHKDKDLSDSYGRAAWTLLKRQIIYIDFIALAMLLYRLLF